MFDIGNTQDNKIKYEFNEKEEMSEKEKFSMEKEMLGIYITGHPLEKMREQILKLTNISSKEMKEIDEQNVSANEDVEQQVQENIKYRDGQEVIIAGIVTSVKKKYTKNNKIMAFVNIEDLNGTAELIVFESTYLKYQDKLIEENIIIVKGRLSIREDDETKIVAQDIKNFGEGFNDIPQESVVKTEIKRPKKIVFDITKVSEEQKDKLRGAIRYFNGDKNNVAIAIKIGEEIKPCGAIYLTDEILKEFIEILGDSKNVINQ